MSTPAYISIKGKTQGNITQGAFTADSVGNVYQEGHEDQILVQEIEHLVATPHRPAERPAVRSAGAQAFHLHRAAEQGHPADVSGAVLG